MSHESEARRDVGGCGAVAAIIGVVYLTLWPECLLWLGQLELTFTQGHFVWLERYKFRRENSASVVPNSFCLLDKGFEFLSRE